MDPALTHMTNYMRAGPAAAEALYLAQRRSCHPFKEFKLGATKHTTQKPLRDRGEAHSHNAMGNRRLRLRRDQARRTSNRDPSCLQTSVKLRGTPI